MEREYLCVTQTDQKDKDRINHMIDDMNLFDDDLMSRVFDENKVATELILRIILRRNVTVISVKGQEELKNPIVGGRKVILDIFAKEVSGEYFNVEVQGNYDGAHVRRARFHSSMIDTRMMEEKNQFKNLNDSFVIFIYKHDKFGLGYPMYHINRLVLESGQLFGDGSNIIFVNGNYKGKDEIGRLIEDFHCKQVKDFHFKELADSVKHFKETEKGREIMCESVKKYCDDKAIQVTVTLVKRLMENMKFTSDQAMDALGINGNDREIISAKIQN